MLSYISNSCENMDEVHLNEKVCARHPDNLSWKGCNSRRIGYYIRRLPDVYYGLQGRGLVLQHVIKIPPSVRVG